MESSAVSSEESSSPSEPSYPSYPSYPSSPSYPSGSSSPDDDDDEPEPEEEDDCGGDGDCPKEDDESEVDEADDDESCDTSDEPVKFSSGMLQLKAVDLRSSGFGIPWGHSRSYANKVSDNALGLNGSSWLVRQLKVLGFGSWTPGSGLPPKICVISGPNSSLWFLNTSGSVFEAEFGSLNTLVWQSSSQQYVLTDKRGRQWLFFDHTLPSGQRGRLKGVSDPSGESATVGHDTSGRVTRFAQVRGALSSAFDYEYASIGGSVTRLSSVRQSVNGRDVRRVQFSYYDFGDANGAIGDLKLADVQQYDSGSGLWRSLRRSHYRYYLSGAAHGFEHGLKFVIQPGAFDRMKAAGIDPLRASDSEVASFADYYFEYDSERRVSRERVRGGQQEFGLEYHSNPTNPGFNDVNTWAIRTQETRPDQSKVRVYSNAAGNTILKILEDENATKKWYEYSQYSADFRRVLFAHPSAVNSVTEPDFEEEDYTLTVNLYDDKGLIEVFDYYTTTNAGTGAAKGKLHTKSVKKGSDGTPELLLKRKYSTRTVSGQSIHPISHEYRYPEIGMADNDALLTTWTRSWYDDTLQVKEVIRTLPVVSTVENGTGVAYQEKTVFDEDGRVTWQMNGRGVITFRSYDPATGALIQRIEDVDTSRLSGVPAGWSTGTDFGLHLVTDFHNDTMGRRLREMGPWHDVQLQLEDDAPTAIRRTRFTTYNDPAHETRQAEGWLAGTEDSPQWQTVGGVRVAQTDSAGQLLQEFTSARACKCGPLTAQEPLPRACWSRWSAHLRDPWGRSLERRDYFEIPTAGEGVEGTHYLATRFGYDEMNRENRVEDATGTIDRRVFDLRGLMESVWTGTNDTGATSVHPSGDGAPGNNMVTVMLNQYDEGSDGGNGNLTESRAPVDGDNDNDRVTQFVYDFRDRRTQVKRHDGTRLLIDVSAYDNLNRVTLVTGYADTVDNANRTSRVGSLYDALGRVFKIEIDGIDPANGDVTETLATQNWYDGANNVVKASEAGKTAFSKSVYDGMNRLRVRYQACVPGTTGVPTGDSNSVSSDTVMEQNEAEFDAASNVIETRQRRRLDTASGTGALQGPNGAQPQARVSSVCQWPDAIGRQRVVADYGTNGGLPMQRPGVAPKRSETVLVTTTLYKDSGDANRSIDPMGIETQWENDKLGRRIRLLEGISPSSYVVHALACPPVLRTTEFAWHPSGQLERLILHNPDTGEQVTRWIFGTTLENSAIASNRLLRAKIYPESDDRPAPLHDGPDGVYARLEYSYNQQGDTTTFKDADGTIHAYEYDKLGRQTQDRVTELAAHLNGAVRRIETSYTARGLLHMVTSYNAALYGTVMNEVERRYDAFNNLIEDSQAHDGAVVDGSTLKVQYNYTSGEGNQLRRTSLTYPNGRHLDSQYGSANSIDDHLNRISALKVNGETDPLVSYTYAGLAWQVVVGLPQPEIELNYKRQNEEPVSDAGDIYFGYDRFGRTIDLRWQKSGTPLVHLQYGFDAKNRRTWRDDLVAPSSAQQDKHYRYDTLSQVVAEDRGDINVNRSAIAGVPASGSRWDYDETGNWKRYEQLANGTTTLDQPRTHDKGNRLMEIGVGAGPVRVDRAGRMLELPPVEGVWDETFEIVWDAWSRIVEVKQGESTVGKYTYDGLTRRITRETGGELIHTYYSDTWRPLEDRVTSSNSPGTPTVKTHYLWGARYRDDLVRRDRATTTSGTLNEKRYVLMDYFSPAAITDEEGEVTERYAFSAFGLRAVLAPNYSTRSTSESDFEFAFQGQFEDSETGWLNYGYRYFIPALGRWPSRDPIWENGGLNLYVVSLNNTINRLDYFGLMTAEECCEDERRIWEASVRAVQEMQSLVKLWRGRVDSQSDRVDASNTRFLAANGAAIIACNPYRPNPIACIAATGALAVAAADLFFQTEILGEYSEAYERYHSQLLRLEEIEKADLDSYIQCLIINGN
jgi:RHS repeat-associated protein